MQASRPDLRFGKDAEERIYRELLAEREEQLRRDAEAREASARNSQELVQRMQSERDRLRQERAEALLKRFESLEAEELAGALVDLVGSWRSARLDLRLLPELLQGLS